jgi:hypothetical protein
MLKEQHNLSLNNAVEQQRAVMDSRQTKMRN